jgi:hypothetical protein
MKAIKEALEWQFEYLNCPFAYKYVKIRLPLCWKANGLFWRRRLKEAKIDLKIVQRNIGASWKRYYTKKRQLKMPNNWPKFEGCKRIAIGLDE